MKRWNLTKEAFKSLKLIYHFLIYFTTSNKELFVVDLLIEVIFYEQKKSLNFK